MIDLNLLSLSIGIGLVVSLLFSEFFGLAAGGLVVPGYIALYLNRPLDVALTLAVALLTFMLVRLASSFVIIYGRRRTVLMILVGYAVGALANNAVGGLDTGIELFSRLPEVSLEVPQGAQSPLSAEPGGIEFGVIGFIVPGLIAIWLDRQGVLPTMAALLTSAVVVRLILVLVAPTGLQWLEAGQPLALGLDQVLR
jgi:poly-gamma-glutamate biosynthesis protein PgsC/CapC